MAKVGINTGSAPNAGDGSSLLAGANAINSNFNEVYNLIGDGTNLLAGIVTSIVAGNNVTVSGSTGAVTINASGGGGGGSIAGIDTTGTSVFNQIIASGVTTAATFSGSGASLTNLNASNLSSGTLPASRITSLNASKLTGTAAAINGVNLTGIVTSIVGGTNVTVSGATGEVTINASGGGSGITVQDEGSALSTLATTLNFAGAGVVASGTGATKTITIAGGGGSLASRTTVQATTASLNAAASGDLSITGYKAYHLLKITVNHPAWVRLYVDAASRTSDASRAEGTDPLPGAGVIAEVLTSTAGSSVFLMSPGVFGWNGSGTTAILAKVTNKDSQARAIQVTMDVIQAEA